MKFCLLLIRNVSKSFDLWVNQNKCYWRHQNMRPASDNNLKAHPNIINNILYNKYKFWTSFSSSYVMAPAHPSAHIPRIPTWMKPTHPSVGVSWQMQVMQWCNKLYIYFNSNLDQQNAKVELYKIGKQLRKRYKDLLGPYYKPDVNTKDMNAKDF